jgi:hypothetical protein
VTCNGQVLGKPWAATRLSVVGAHDSTTYCFTKKYGRGLVDRSSGSCFLEGAEGPLADQAFALDRTRPLTYLHGRLRRFDPDEILAISGFPPAFVWPDEMTLEKRWVDFCWGFQILR